MSSDVAPAGVTTSLQLVLPPDPQLLRIVRLVASGLASLTQLTLDDVEEVRVAADELVSTLMEASESGAGAPVTVELALTDGALRLEASTPLAAGQTLEVDAMTDALLDNVATSHEWATVDGTARGVVERALLG